MLLRRWEPFSHIHSSSHSFPRMALGFPATSDGGHDGRWRLPLDVFEEDENLVLRASVPGVEPEDIEVTIEDGILTIKGQTSEESESREKGYIIKERRTGSFHRSLRLPDRFDPDKAESDYENGVLTVHLPKAEEKRAKRLAVAVNKP